MTRLLGLLLGAACLTMPGCGGGPDNVAPVSGKVSLDGAPLPDALVEFAPQGDGTPSYGRTGTGGEYELIYSREAKGAEIGKHTVRIRTYAEGNPDADPPEPEKPEKVPAKYNANSELTANVTDGSNTFDFDLKGEGEIVTPEEAAASSEDDSTCF